MAGVAADCSSITISGVDFTNVTNLVSAKLIITKGCCSGAGTPIEYELHPTPALTIDEAKVILTSEDLEQTDDQLTAISDGVYNFTVEWIYTDDSANEITQSDTTCSFVGCGLRCQITNAVRNYYIDGSNAYTSEFITKIMNLYDALTIGAIACEYCNTACTLYSEIYKLLNNQDCKCQ